MNTNKYTNPNQCDLLISAEIDSHKLIGNIFIPNPNQKEWDDSNQEELDW